MIFDFNIDDVLSNSESSLNSFIFIIYNLYFIIIIILYSIVQEDTLLDMVCVMKNDVALVHQMPFVCDRKGFPAVLEKVSAPYTLIIISSFASFPVYRLLVLNSSLFKLIKFSY